MKKWDQKFPYSVRFERKYYFHHEINKKNIRK